MKYESIIFDIDGTLWDSRALVTQAYNEQIRSEGLDHLQVTPEDLIPLFGKVTEDLADALFPSLPPAERYGLIARCFDREVKYLWTQECKVGYPGVTETIAKLAEKYRIFIVSNCQLGYPEVCMDKLGLTPYIEGHLCFEQTGTRKGLTLKTLMEKHNVGSCIYVGDTQGDYEATVEAGIPFIFASFGFGTPESYIAKINKFEDLLEIL